MDAKLMNGMSLAYIGDSVYEVYIREYVLSKGYNKVKDLHKNVIIFTSGESQADIVHHLINDNILCDEELTIFKRGRNSHVHSVRKNISIQDYLDATGFEAVIGYLYLNGQKDRMEELIDYSIKIRSDEND
ncbi:MAG: ribonuclease III [Acholeplasmatales bacterium]|nr:ribonuclease III [Acholeplasmatales bacterium]